MKTFAEKNESNQTTREADRAMHQPAASRIASGAAADRMHQLRGIADHSPQVRQLRERADGIRQHQAAAAPLQLSSSAPIQLATEINYQRGNIGYRRAYNGGNQWANQDVGIDTEAYLDPADPKTGSRTGGGAGIYASGLYSAINHQKHLTQGHLLNANLGGHALDENLFPITSDMNKAHSVQVEDQVKTQLLKLHREQVANTPNWNNRRLYYRVQVQHPAMNAITPQNLRNTAFDCFAYITDNGGTNPDHAEGNLNTRVTAPYDLNTELAGIGFAPDAGPSYVLGAQIHAGPPAVHQVNDQHGAPVAGMQITL